MAAVAGRAGVSVGLPYRYFGTRSGLLTAVLSAFYDRLDDAVITKQFAGRTWHERERARVRAWVAIALTRSPRPPGTQVADEVWAFVAGAAATA
ncbi:TetR/AcrR family transcriptional regulator [Pseudonocardia sp. TRM90224]|uniref:TetR/AcrR family transcriptional regulator n=1 Tax=Pseudonocardia sp. TRM90224 TaxID=2812678 RepID=UPI001E5EF043|nr:hypothetical protein [Pseudonocardia sp. TRM90224]